MKVETHQFTLQVVYEGVAIEKIPNDAVRERLTVQLQISCKQQVNSEILGIENHIYHYSTNTIAVM